MNMNMNKTTKIVLIVALCIFGVGLLVLVGSSIVTGYKLSDIGTASGEMTVLTDGGDVKYAEKEIADGSQDLDIDVSFADVVVGKSSDGKIHISYPEGSKLRFELKEHADKISLSQEQNKLSLLGFGSPAVQVELLIPEEHAGDLEIDTASGSIELSRVSIEGSFDLSTASGSIAAGDCVCGKSEFSTASGDVELSSLDTSALEVDTASGHIMIDGVASEPSADLATNSGYISVSSSRLSELEVGTHTGNVTLADLTAGRCAVENTSAPCELDNVKTDELRVSTVSGSVRGSLVGSEADYTITTKTVSGRNSLMNLGGHGSKTIYISTTSGDIELDFAE